MTLTILEEKPSAEMAGRLEQFELLFTYPLGPTQRFRISHGNDYPLFFRAIGGGNSASFVAGDKRGEILGTLGAALRRVRLADGTLRVVAYVGDLKTRPGLDQGRTLVRLALEATRWCRARGALSAYGVVMDGTARLPADYSGRCGILPFSPIGKFIHYARHAELDHVHADEFFELIELKWDEPARQESIRRGLALGAHVFDRLYRDLHEMD